MDSRAKRKVFRDAFKDRLSENGFVYRNNMFVRIHPGEAMLFVLLDLTPSGAAYICFDALPMCCAFEDLQAQLLFESHRMDGYSFIHIKEVNDPKLDEPWGITNFGLQYREFWNNIFDDLNAVHDIESVYTFTRNLPYKGNVYKFNKSEAAYDDVHRWTTVFSGIYVQEWDVVLTLLNRLMQTHRECISRGMKNLSDLESKPKKGKYDDFDIKAIKEYIMGHRQQYDLKNTIKTMVENGDHAGLNQMLEENRIQWDAYCKEKWPMFYHQ